MKKNETIPGSLPPFVVYHDGTVYSVRNVADEAVIAVDATAVVLVPVREVNEVLDGVDDRWDTNGLTCWALTTPMLHQMLDNDYESWAAAHSWGEAWRLGVMLTARSKQRRAAA